MKNKGKNSLGILETWVEGREPDERVVAFVEQKKKLRSRVGQAKYNPYHRTGTPGQPYTLDLFEDGGNSCQGIYLTVSPATYVPRVVDFLTACCETIMDVRRNPTVSQYAAAFGLPNGTHYEMGEVAFRYNTAKVVENHLRTVFGEEGLAQLLPAVEEADRPEAAPLTTPKTEKKAPPKKGRVAEKPRTDPSHLAALFSGL